MENTQKFQLQQVDNIINEQLNSLEQTVVKWSFNRVFSRILESTDINKEFETVSDLQNTLSLIKDSHNLIGNSFLFIMGEERIFTDQFGLVRLNTEQIRKISELTTRDTGNYYLDEYKLDFIDVNDSFDTLFVVRIRSDGIVMPGAILVSLNSKFVDVLLKQLNLGQTGITFLLRESGSIYTDSVASDGIDTELTNALKTEVLQYGKGVGNFMYNFKGETYSVAYRYYEKSHWTYVAAIPLSKMYAPVKKTSQLLLLVSLMAVIMILIITLLLSRSLYRPVGQLAKFMKSFGQESVGESGEAQDEFNYIRSKMTRINDERKELREYLDKNKAILREGFLLQLVQKHLHYYSEIELRETMSRMGWKLKGKYFTAVFIKLFIPNSESVIFSHGDEQLATYAAANIIEETAADYPGLLGIINFHNLSTALLLENSGEIEEFWNFEDSLCNAILKRLSGYLGMQVVIGVGPKSSQVCELSTVFEMAVQCIRYRDVTHGQEIIYAEDLLSENEKPISYPLELETEIAHDIRIGMLEDAAGKVSIFAAELQKQSGKEFFIQQGMLHLLGSMLHAIMQSGVDINRIYLDNNLYEQLCSIKEPPEMVQWFKDIVIAPLAGLIQETQEMKYKQMVERVLRYIQENYMKDISLDICANEVPGIPAKRLSVIFTRITGKNFVDMVTDLRMEKAKVLLHETDEKINDIAIKVGYQPQYFNKLFKKREGMTPGEYRQANR